MIVWVNSMGKEDNPKYDLLKREDSPSLDYEDRLIGAVLGFAIGDALGAPAEFLKKRGSVSGYLDSPRKGLKRGQFTDDTQHLMIGLESLIIDNGDLNLQDQADRLITWYRSNQARSIGRTTRLAIENLISGADYTTSGINHPANCGSLALSRLLPVSLISAINRRDYKIGRKEIKRILSITHAHKDVANMGELFNYFIQTIMHGKDTRDTVDMILFESDFLNKRIRKRLSHVYDLAQSSKDPLDAIHEIGNGGYVEDVVFSSIYGALKGTDFTQAVLISVNAGGDTDSRGALTGALYGLYVGEKGIPNELKKELEKSDDLRKMSRQLFYLRK
jgi:ADP-ribosylglycohydrolase